MTTPAPYPLTFEPILKEKVWGGDRLRAWGKPVEPGAKVGESWEIADLAST
ncbi:MAG: mannose-6-phosphate isomerase, partial [Planctomycetota bacterium]